MRQASMYQVVSLYFFNKWKNFCTLDIDYYLIMI